MHEKRTFYERSQPKRKKAESMKISNNFLIKTVSLECMLEAVVQVNNIAVCGYFICFSDVKVLNESFTKYMVLAGQIN